MDDLQEKKNSKMKVIFQKANLEEYSQDVGIGRDPSLPPKTKRWITTNLKSINNQKWQKIKLHGILTTKELKKKLNHNNQTSKNLWQGCGPCRQAWLKSKLRLRAGCGLRQGCHGGRYSQSHTRVR